MRAVPIISTPRFTMRPLRREDAAALFPTLSDPAQCLYLTRPAFTSEEELWDWLGDPGWNGRTWTAEDTAWPNADTPNAGTPGAGVAARLIAKQGLEEGVEEIGYITCAHRQREGVARECAKALVEHLLGEGARKITAEVDAENAASIALLESLGFKREAHFREHETSHVGLRDVYWYGLLRGDPRPAC
jgi:RimJ/RimL family protein N-acetyltransferase